MLAHTHCQLATCALKNSTLDSGIGLSAPFCYWGLREQHTNLEWIWPWKYQGFLCVEMAFCPCLVCLVYLHPHWCFLCVTLCLFPLHLIPSSRFGSLTDSLAQNSCDRPWGSEFVFCGKKEQGSKRIKPSSCPSFLSPKHRRLGQEPENWLGVFWHFPALADDFLTGLLKIFRQILTCAESLKTCTIFTLKSWNGCCNIKACHRTRML